MTILKSSLPSVPVSNETVHEKLLRAAWNHSIINRNRPALISARDAFKYITFGELYTQAHSVAAFLRSYAFKGGDVAALVLQNCIEWPVVFLGVCAAGGAISRASALFTDYELEGQFRDSHCSIVFTDEEHLQKVQHAARNCEQVHTIICVRSPSSSHTHFPGNVIDWQDVISTRPIGEIYKCTLASNSYDENKITVGDPDDLATLPYSSGTTGPPKGVMLSHRNLGTIIEILKSHFEIAIAPYLNISSFDWKTETLIHNLPFYHGYGFSMLCVGILAGCTGVVLDKFEPDLYLKAISQYRPKLLYLVPPILIFLTKNSIVKEYDFSSIKFVMSAAAPAGKEICEAFLGMHKNVEYLAQGYGMTECGIVSHWPMLTSKDTYTYAGALCSTFEQMTIDPISGKELGPGEKGEICVRGPTVMVGYLNRPEATTETIDKDGWLHTGDIGYFTEDGRTYIVDRIKELIKVAPAEIEDLLLSHPHIRDVAVIGIPDEKRGELVRAYVARANDSLNALDVIEYVSHKVSEYKHITGGVKFIQEVPISPSGKILRRILREQAAAEMKGVKSKL